MGIISKVQCNDSDHFLSRFSLWLSCPYRIWFYSSSFTILALQVLKFLQMSAIFPRLVESAGVGWATDNESVLGQRQGRPRRRWERRLVNSAGVSSCRILSHRVHELHDGSNGADDISRRQRHGEPVAVQTELAPTLCWRSLLRISLSSYVILEKRVLTYFNTGARLSDDNGSLSAPLSYAFLPFVIVVVKVYFSIEE